MKKIYSTLFVVVLVLSLVLAAPIIHAATIEEVEDSIEKGLAWLVDQQPSGGYWPSPHYQAPVAITGFALTKLCDRAYEIGISPFDPNYEYMENVILGFDYLFSQASDAYIGIAFDIGTSEENYCTGIAAMAIASSRMPDRLVPTGPYAGQTYKQVLQEIVNYFAWAQVDAPSDKRGGWGYSVGGNTTHADQSNTGYSVLALRYAEAGLYGFQCNVPQVVRDELTFWINYIQLPDGGSAYTEPLIEGSNLLRTGNLLFEQSFVGIDIGDTRVQHAIGYIEDNWNPTADSQTMYCLMKGFESYGIETITVDGNPVDWYDVFADWIIACQHPDGYWESLSWERELDTPFALLTLERAAPPSLYHLDHFTCYEMILPGEALGTVVHLEDQFVAINATVEGAEFFCNPATKVHSNMTTPILNPDHHLTIYSIEEELGETYSVKVDNQFGHQYLTISGPVGLVVPTQKVGPWYHEPPWGLDHFLYYDVIDGSDMDVDIDLGDEFLDEQNGSVMKPIGFASPVQKTHGGNVTVAQHPDEYLVFYEYEGDFLGITVQFINQFESLSLLVNGPVRLAVPSTPLEPCILTISVNGAGSVLPGVGTFYYDCGTNVTLIASPSDNCWFIDWTGDVGRIDDVEDPATWIIVDDNYSITANFDCQQIICGEVVGASSAHGTPISREVQTILGFLMIVSVPAALWVRSRLRRGSKAIA